MKTNSDGATVIARTRTSRHVTVVASVTDRDDRSIHISFHAVFDRIGTDEVNDVARSDFDDVEQLVRDKIKERVGYVDLNRALDDFTVVAVRTDISAGVAAAAVHIASSAVTAAFAEDAVTEAAAATANGDARPAAIAAAGDEVIGAAEAVPSVAV